MSVKIDRIGSTLVKEISYILMTEIKDHDIKFVTVIDCKVTGDLGYAKVYYTILDDEKKESTALALKNAAGFIRKQLFDRVDIRHIPELEFIYDESIAYGNKIEKLIEKIEKTESIDT